MLYLGIMDDPLPPAEPFPSMGFRVETLKKFLTLFDDESERGAVLIAATILDELLGRAIAARLLDNPDVKQLLKGFNAPLGTFSARILAAFSLGVISVIERDDLTIIRKIRNEFAHSLGASFQDQRIRDLCTQFGFGVASFKSKAPAIEQFRSASLALLSYLSARPYQVSKRRLVFEFPLAIGDPH